MTSKDKLIEFLKSAEIDYTDYEWVDKEWTCIETSILLYIFSPTGTFEGHYING